MPLINLTTDLKSLQYGNDRPGGGSSGLPYIVSPRPDQIVPPPSLTGVDDFTKFYELNQSTRDYPIRGGSEESENANGLSTTPAGQIDRSRIRAFMNDPQKGKIFLLKQEGLQLTNPKIPGPTVLAPAQLKEPTRLLEATRYYDIKGVNTLEQVGTQGTGTHITRHGIGFGNYLTGIPFGYEASTIQSNDWPTNRLILLTFAKLGQNPIFRSLAGEYARYGITNINSQILNYEGGPGSVYGDGTTIIKRATNTDTSKAYSSVALSYDSLLLQDTSRVTSNAHPDIQDFRTKLTGKRWYADLTPTSYSIDWIQNRLKTGNPGGVYLDQGYDELNALGPFTNETLQKPWELSINGAGTPAPDMIKFVFECMSNDDPGSSVALIFRSFLTGITDNHQAEFNSFKYLGRGETFRTYQGFDRTINFSFKIAAFSDKEMKALYTKLNHLASQMYPDYSPTTRFMRGNVIKLTIGDYLYRVPGFVENVNITIDDNVAWEIGLNNNMNQLPQMVTVQCAFKPIHDILPRRVKMGDEYVPLIANTPAPYLSETIQTGLLANKGVYQPDPDAPYNNTRNLLLNKTGSLDALTPLPTMTMKAFVLNPPLQNRTAEYLTNRDVPVQNRTREMRENRP